MSTAITGPTVAPVALQFDPSFARRELVMTDKPIAEIAFSAGFSDHAQLTKTFKRVTGQTPTAYRVQHR